MNPTDLSVEDRLDALEARLDAYDGALRLIRWASPIVVAVAAILIQRLG